MWNSVRFWLFSSQANRTLRKAEKALKRGKFSTVYSCLAPLVGFTIDELWRAFYTTCQLSDESEYSLLRQELSHQQKLIIHKKKKF